MEIASSCLSAGNPFRRTDAIIASQITSMPGVHFSGQPEEMIRAVRNVNASLPDATKLRVIAGDPPFDWDNITSSQDHRRWG